MDPIIIAVIVILCQYPLAILTLLKLFKTGLNKSQSIVWDVVIVGLPFVGAAAFWLAYLIKYRKIKSVKQAPETENRETENDNKEKQESKE